MGKKRKFSSLEMVLIALFIMMTAVSIVFIVLFATGQPGVKSKEGKKKQKNYTIDSLNNL